MLHFAPEARIAARLHAIDELDYRSADLDPEAADLVLDLCDIALPDEDADAIICSHVLEHVQDDSRALRELFRVLKPGGWLLVMVPINKGVYETIEDPSVTDPAERRRLFWQEDHVRLYGDDVADRIAAVGFDVETLNVTQMVDRGEIIRLRLDGRDDIFIARK